MKINAQIVADSTNEFGNRITTFVLTYPRIIHAEVMTHRMFSRNAASSRAVPFNKLCESIQKTPFIPLAFQKDHKGMQGSEYYTEEEIKKCGIIEQWLGARDMAIYRAKALSEIGVTKQICNRLLEPFQWYQTIVTATEYENFFALRCPKYESTDSEKQRFCRSKKDWWNTHPGHEGSTFSEEFWRTCNKGQAEIHMMALAEAMWDAYNESTPKQLKAGEWHIPFGDQIDMNKLQHWGEPDDRKIEIAVARCARVSYTVVGEENKEPNYENDIELHDRLAESGHMSPFEHIGRAMNEKEFIESICGQVEGLYDYDGMDPISPIVSLGADGWSGNLRGFIQYRKTLSGENFDQPLYGSKTN